MNKVIFWDFDGTLVYSEHLWSGSLLKTLERYTPKSDSAMLSSVTLLGQTSFTLAAALSLLHSLSS